jgi:hypothetical protein
MSGPYYGLHHPLLSAAIPEVLNRVPDADYKQTIINDIRKQFQEPEIDLTPCCVKSQPCKTWIQWKPELSDCPQTYVSWSEATNGKVHGFEVGQKDSRIWVASLDPMRYNRGILTGARWPAESTQGHIRNRQAFAQYLQSTLYPNASPDLKRIDRVEDSYGVMLHRYGKPQYTSF